MADTIPSDITTTATLEVGGYVYSTIDRGTKTGSDVDWFKIELPVGSYAFNLVGDPAIGSDLAAPSMTIYDSTGHSLLTASYSATDKNASTNFNVNAAATYFIGVHSGTRAGTGTYFLEVQEKALTVSDPGYIEPGMSLFGYLFNSFDGYFDEDRYAVPLITGHTYTFDAESDVASIYLAASADGPSLGVNLHQPYTPTSTGTYYVAVTGGVENHATFYTLSVTNSAGPHKVPTGANTAVSVTEDVPYAFSEASFGVVDVANYPASNALITSLPGHGTLKLNGVAVTVGQTIAGSSLAQLKWTPPANTSGDAMASLTFTVTDGLTGRGAGTTHTVTFNVAAVNDAPVIDSNGGNPQQISLVENTFTVATVFAHDVDSSTITYSLTGADAALFKLDASSGAVWLKANPDFETPKDADHNNIYDVNVVASDGSATDSEALHFTVTNFAGNTIAANGHKNTIDATHKFKGLGATGEEDHIDGKGGNDQLRGLGGNDTLIGGKGNDKLTGGAGRDELTGGKGNDHFVFNTALGKAGVDTIVDFAHKHDHIDLDNAVMAALGHTGALAGTAFYAHAHAKHGHDADDRVIYNTKSGALYYDPDGNGAHAATQIAVLTNHPTLSATDIWVV